MSTCLGGALVRALLSCWIADGVGRRSAFQLCALPMIVGASMRYACTINIIALDCLLGLCVAIGLVSLILYTLQLDLVLVYNRLIVVSDSWYFLIL